jgi:hypothetical protein
VKRSGLAGGDRVRLDRPRNRLRGDAVVRRLPHHASIHHEQRLRRLVPDAEAGCDVSGQGAVRLYGDDAVTRGMCALLQVAAQFVERVGARTARSTVLKDETRVVFVLRRDPHASCADGRAIQEQFDVVVAGRETSGIFNVELGGCGALVGDALLGFADRSTAI